MTLDDENTTTPPAARPRTRRRAASRPAGPPTTEALAETATAPATQTAPEPAAQTAPEPAAQTGPEPATEGTAPRKRARRTTKAAAATPAPDAAETAAPTESDPPPRADEALAEPEPAPRRRRARKAAAPAPEQQPEVAAEATTLAEPAAEATTLAEPAAEREAAEPEAERPNAAPAIMPIFQAPEPVAAPARARGTRRRAASRPAGPPQHAPEVAAEPAAVAPATEAGEDAEIEVTAVEGEVTAAAVVDGIASVDETAEDQSDDVDDDETDDEDDEATGDAARRRRRRRGGRGRRGRSGRDQDGADEAGSTDAPEPTGEAETEASDDASEEEDDEDDAAEGSTRRRRRRRRRSGNSAEEPSPDDPPNTVVRVRESRRSSGGGGGGGGEVSGVRGSTRLEAKKMRRREGREAGRRRPLLTEAEFLARRESVERVMVVRENDGRTQIGVLEDGVLVEHYVARRTQATMVGNVYLGRVQNVLPSMEAAFVDIGKGRNAVIYAGEVNWDAAGLEGQPKRIEHALKAGESILVQVTKEPIGHKGARLTSQVSLPGRYLVYVPDGSMTGISRKLPDTERARLKKILRDVVPDDAGVIVRTAAEGASEEELQRDVARLQAQWDDISRKAGAVNAPALLYGEPDLAIRVVRDIFNEDFGKLVVEGDDVWDTLQSYMGHVAPDLVERLERWDPSSTGGDAFAHYRIDEQIAKAMDRKVWLPSGGSLVIDRTEAMTVVDVNTGKFTGAGGNLEETVTKNNLEAAEEIVRQLRLRDIGGIIVIDFIDMVLESNRDLVLRRLLECLGRDRTKHQVAEVTSLGLVQMTRKRVGQGLIEVFSETCEVCGGRGIIVHDDPVEKRANGGSEGNRGRSGGSGGAGGSGGHSHAEEAPAAPAEEAPADSGGARGRRRRGGNRQPALAEGA